MSVAISAGFTMLVPAREGARVLELSEDDGARAAALGAAGCVVTCARAAEPGADALRRIGLDAVAVADERRLRGVPGPFDAVVLSLSTGRSRGGERIVADPRTWARGGAELLRPGGALVLVVPNPLYGLPLVAGLLDRARGELQAGGLRGPLVPRASGARAVRRAIEEAGLVRPSVFAALPGVIRLKFLVPVERREAAEFFFRVLVPRARRAPARALLHFAGVAASHGFLETLSPAYCGTGLKEPAP